MEPEAEATWTQQDFESSASRHMVEGLAKPEQFQQCLADFFKEAMAHHENATAGGQAYLEQVVDRLGGFLSEVLKAAPDTAENRKARRVLASVQGKHFETKALFEQFTRLPAEPDAELDRAAEVLIRTTQSLMDVLHDATRNTQRGTANFAMVGLFFWFIDEVTAAQFLARRGYATLAYTRLRSLMEINDKIELFTKQPKYAEVWTSGDEGKIWKELAPPRVREKLGRSNFDPVYRYFSEQGSHSTFTALQARVRKRPPTATQGLGIAMLIGGVWDRVRQISILIYAAVLANLALHRAVMAFADRLHGEDAGRLVIASNEDCFGLIEAVFSRAKADQLDLQPLELLRKAWAATRDEIMSASEKEV